MIRMSHRGVCVSDFEAADRFYREALGFEEHQDYGVLEGPDMDKTMDCPGCACVRKCSAIPVVR